MDPDIKSVDRTLCSLWKCLQRHVGKALGWPDVTEPDPRNLDHLELVVRFVFFRDVTRKRLQDAGLSGDECEAAFAIAEAYCHEEDYAFVLDSSRGYHRVFARIMPEDQYRKVEPHIVATRELAKKFHDAQVRLKRLGKHTMEAESLRWDFASALCAVPDEEADRMAEQAWSNLKPLFKLAVQLAPWADGLRGLRTPPDSPADPALVGSHLLLAAMAFVDWAAAIACGFGRFGARPYERRPVELSHDTLRSEIAFRLHEAKVRNKQIWELLGQADSGSSKYVQVNQWIKAADGISRGSAS
jgi:hypothetical protein